MIQHGHMRLYGLRKREVQFFKSHNLKWPYYEVLNRCHILNYTTSIGVNILSHNAQTSLVL